MRFLLCVRRLAIEQHCRASRRNSRIATGGNQASGSGGPSLLRHLLHQARRVRPIRLLLAQTVDPGRVHPVHPLTATPPLPARSSRNNRWSRLPARSRRPAGTPPAAPATLPACIRSARMHPYRQPASLRVQVFLCGAILGRAGHQTGLHLSSAWGGLEKRNSLFDRLLLYEIPTSRKLEIQPEPAA